MTEKTKEPMDREEMFARVDAAKVYSQSIRSQQHAEDTELAAFMAIFHPEFEGDLSND